MEPVAQRKVDGCAIFWQIDCFDKVTEFHHEFMLSCSNVSEHPSALLLNRVMTRDNVALGVVFECKGLWFYFAVSLLKSVFVSSRFYCYVFF